jgi:hypothetical protein
MAQRDATRPKNLSQEDYDAEELKAQFNDVFSLRKPKDVRAGLSSGAKSIGKGVLAGAVGLVATPVIMARDEGVKGFAKGVGAGEESRCNTTLRTPQQQLMKGCDLLTECYFDFVKIVLYYCIVQDL